MPYVLPKRFQLSTDSNLYPWDISLQMLELPLLRSIWKETVEKKTGVLLKIKKSDLDVALRFAEMINRATKCKVYL
jgi:hypothetical protein